MPKIWESACESTWPPSTSAGHRIARASARWNNRQQGSATYGVGGIVYLARGRTRGGMVPLMDRWTDGGTGEGEKVRAWVWQRRNAVWMKVGLPPECRASWCRIVEEITVTKQTQMSNFIDDYKDRDIKGCDPCSRHCGEATKVEYRVKDEKGMTGKEVWLSLLSVSVALYLEFFLLFFPLNEQVKGQPEYKLSSKGWD